MNERISRLKNDEKFFNYEFNHLKEFYEFKDESEVYGFIEKSPELIIVLDEMKNSLKNKFPEAEFELLIDNDYEISEETLVLDIKVDEYTFDNGIMEGIHAINGEFRLLNQKLGVVSKIFLMPALFTY